MQDRFQVCFEERMAQSRIAKLANLEAFKAALAPISQDNADCGDQAPEMPPAVATASVDSKVSSGPKPLLRWVPRRARTPLLAATAGIAALGAAACTSGNNTEIPQAPTNQGEVLGAHATPVPTNAEQTKDNFIAPGQKIGDFVLKGPDRNVFRSSDATGKPMMIIFCCNQYDLEVHAINNLKSHYGNNLVILPIFVLSDPNSIPSVKQAYQEDPSDKNSLFARLMARGTPHFVPVSKDGIVGEGKDGDDNLSFLDSASQKLIDGVDVNEVFPTPTPGPTETSTPVITKEQLPSDEAVFDLGSFGLAITGWEELTNVQPYQIGVAEGKRVDVKTVVVHGIVRNITNSIQEFKQFSPNSFEPTVGINFVDSAGKDLEYYPGLAKVLPQFVVPLAFSGVFNEPFEKGLDGSMNRIDTLYQAPNPYPTELIAVPGFGLPVDIVASVPINTRDYGIAIVQSGLKNGERKVVMKDQVANGFKTIENGAPIGSPGEYFGGEVIKGGNYKFTFKSMETGQSSPGTEKNNVAIFHFVTEPQSQLALPYIALRGLLYLDDGRVLKIAFTDGVLQPGQEGDAQAFAGSLNPDGMFPLADHKVLKDAYDLDLHNSTIVLVAGQMWKAWKVQ